MTLAAVDGADRARQLITLTERLCERLLEEIDAFEARRPHILASRSAETLKLANLYRHESHRIQTNPGLLAGVAGELRERLAATTRRFQDILAHHGRAVGAAKTITEGLVQAVASEVAARRTRSAGYGPTARALQGDARAITLNKRA
jgi:ribosomal protein S25